MLLDRLASFFVLIVGVSTVVDAFGSQPTAFSSSVVVRPRCSTCRLGESTANDRDDGGVEAPHSEITPKKKMKKDDDILNSPAFLKRKLEVLKSDLAAAEKNVEATKERLEAGKAEWGAQLEELQKEYKNIQDRMNAQSNQGDGMAILQVARQMLTVLDNFDRAFGAVTPSTDEEREIEAEYRETYDMILDSFKKLGVEEVETVGLEFDYAIHQAVMQRPSDEYEEGIVCEELQKGFKLGDKLVRAAMVAVAA